MTRRGRRFVLALAAALAPSFAATAAPSAQPRHATGLVVFHVVVRSNGSGGDWDWEILEGFGEMLVRMVWRDGAWTDDGSRYAFRAVHATGDQGWACERSGNTEGAIRELGPLTAGQDYVSLDVARSGGSTLQFAVSTTGTPWIIGEAPRDECAAPRPWVQWGQSLSCAAGRLSADGRSIRFEQSRCFTINATNVGESVNLQGATLNGRVTLTS